MAASYEPEQFLAVVASTSLFKFVVMKSVIGDSGLATDGGGKLKDMEVDRNSLNGSVVLGKGLMGLRSSWVRFSLLGSSLNLLLAYRM
ncbi:hypothetical protein ACOSQ2_029123 [Xanthoceras sorbifolium]